MITRVRSLYVHVALSRIFISLFQSIPSLNSPYVTFLSKCNLSKFPKNKTKLPSRTTHIYISKYEYKIQLPQLSCLLITLVVIIISRSKFQSKNRVTRYGPFYRNANSDDDQHANMIIAAIFKFQGNMLNKWYSGTSGSLF